MCFLWFYIMRNEWYHICWWGCRSIVVICPIDIHPINIPPASSSVGKLARTTISPRPLATLHNQIQPQPLSLCFSFSLSLTILYTSLDSCAFSPHPLHTKGMLMRQCLCSDSPPHPNGVTKQHLETSLRNIYIYMGTHNSTDENPRGLHSPSCSGSYLLVTSARYSTVSIYGA